MKYRLHEDKNVITESEIPKEEWGFGTEITISYQSDRLNPENPKYYYVCLEGNDLTASWDKIFETNSKKKAQEWVDERPISRTWHEKIRISDSQTTTNK